MSKIVKFTGTVLLVEVVVVTQAGEKAAVVITDGLHEPVFKLASSEKLLNETLKFAIHIAELYDAGSIDWMELEELF